mgnify:CR=1 FL=1
MRSRHPDARVCQPVQRVDLGLAFGAYTIRGGQLLRQVRILAFQRDDPCLPAVGPGRFRVQSRGQPGQLTAQRFQFGGLGGAVRSG